MISDPAFYAAIVMLCGVFGLGLKILKKTNQSDFVHARECDLRHQSIEQRLENIERTQREMMKDIKSLLQRL